MSGEKILVDTSVWIRYFKDKSTRFSGKMDDILLGRYVDKSWKAFFHLEEERQDRQFD